MATSKKNTGKTRKAKKPSPKNKGHQTTKASLSASAKKKTVTIDRRKGEDRRTLSNRRQKNVPVAVERRVVERRVKVNRRRQIDPTTCERDYTQDEIEFMNALDEYKRANGRMFPTCSEVLEVIRKLGYQRRPAVEPLPETESLAPFVPDSSLVPATDTVLPVSV